ncbi:MAG TPA: DUF6789 family protein, partial [Gammaproteobacteria bacterium]|nr:DUF6789 family protein [Gammaproteobacteria bacterium]
MTRSISKGIAAGFFATLIMGLALFAAAGLNFYPPLIRRLALISHDVIGSPMWLWIGWAYHFAIGTLAWGILFGLVACAVRARSRFGTWFTAIVFAACAWVLMMVIVMPLSGAGFFARSVGLGPLIVMAIWHFIWGTVLGLSYYAMTKPAVIEHRVHDRIIGVPIFRGFRWRRSHQTEEPLPPTERPAPRAGE